jgi:2-dehydro-3-deoxygluconokinase
MTDLVTFGETPLQFSPPGKERLETARETTLYADGTESNAAVAASQLGTASTWVSKLPASALSRRVVRELERHGIETSIAWASESEARQGLVFRETGHPPRDPQWWHDRDGTGVAAATPSDLPMDLVQQADVVYTGLTTPALSKNAESTVTAMLRAAAGSGATTAVDVDYQAGLRPPQSLREALLSTMEHANALIGNEEHVRTVLDTSGKPRDLANSVATEHDLDTVVITRSDRGAVALQDTPGTKVIHERETIDRPAVDESGQHGAFAGGFLARLADGAELSEALSYGVAAAALVRTIPGPLLTANREEIEQVVDDVVEASR